jgi:acyl carrier protein
MTRSAFRRVLEEILDLPHDSLTDGDNRDTVPNWSSVADVQILTTIGSQFGIEPDAVLLEAETVGDLLDILEQRGVVSS